MSANLFEMLRQTLDGKPGLRVKPTPPASETCRRALATRPASPWSPNLLGARGGRTDFESLARQGASLLGSLLKKN